MNPLSNYPSKKSIHIVWTDGRKSFLPAFDPAVDGKFNPKTRFSPEFQCSQFMEYFLPEGTTYGEVSVYSTNTEDQEAGLRWLENLVRGYNNDKLPVPGTYRVLWGDFDDHGMAIIVPERCGINRLEALAGLVLMINNEASVAKVRKYFRRIRAHHEWAIPGDVTGHSSVETGEVLSINCNGITFDVLHVDIDKMDPRNKALADGMCLVSIHTCHALGEMFGIRKLKNAKLGSAFKGTMLSKLGLGKGFFHVVSMEKYGLIVYGPKTLVKFDRFFFGSLGDCKAGEAFTNIQPLTSFLNDESYPIFKGMADLFLNEYADVRRDEHKLRSMLLRFMPDMAETLRKNEGNLWILLEALRAGIPLNKNPRLMDMVDRFMMTDVINMKRGRIPFGKKGRYLNLMSDLHCFDYETGVVDHTKSVIPEDAVICMDMQRGPIALAPMPMGHAKSAVVTTNIHNRRFRSFIGKGWCIGGPSVLEHYAAMDGRDGDDLIIAIDDADLVEVINKAEYPEAELPGSDEAVVHPLHKNNPFLRQRKFPSTWKVNPDFLDACVRAREDGMSLGIIDNAIRLTTLLSGAHKDHGLQILAQRRDEATDPGVKHNLTTGYVEWSELPEHPLAALARSIETAVDSFKMGVDSAQIDAMRSQIMEALGASPVYPRCWNYIAKSGNSRIPWDRRQLGDFTLVETWVDTLLEEVDFTIAQMMERFRQDQWIGVESIPATLNMLYPRDPNVRAEALALRKLWRDNGSLLFGGTELLTELKSGKRLDDSKEGRKLSFNLMIDGGKVKAETGEEFEIEGIKPRFNLGKPNPGEDYDFRTAVAVDIARLTYRGRHKDGRKDDEGKYRRFSDGLLWTSCIGLQYIRALDEAELSGLYVPVSFDEYSAGARMGRVEVIVQCDMVVRAHDGLVIGETFEAVPNGSYFMEDGLIVVKTPSDELTMTLNSDDDLSNPVMEDEEAEIEA